MTDIFSLMDACFERGASDLHVSVGRPPVLRLHGGLQEIGTEPVTPEQLEAYAKRQSQAMLEIYKALAARSPRSS